MIHGIVPGAADRIGVLQERLRDRSVFAPADRKQPVVLHMMVAPDEARREIVLSILDQLFVNLNLILRHYRMLDIVMLLILLLAGGVALEALARKRLAVRTQDHAPIVGRARGPQHLARALA